MIINVQGTGGAGKSHVVRRIMDLYPIRTPRYREGRKQPIGYRCDKEGYTSLVVPGHYETPCGGCDTITKPSDVFLLVEEAALGGVNVIFEGIISQDSALGIIELSKKFPTLVIALNTPIVDCIAGIQTRRDARGDLRPLDTKNTIARERSLKTRVSRLRDNNVKVLWLGREEAFEMAKGALEL